MEVGAIADEQRAILSLIFGGDSKSADALQARHVARYKNSDPDGSVEISSELNPILAASQNENIEWAENSQPSASPPSARRADQQDLSETIEGLQRCEGLRDVIQQIESGAVQAIRDRYGPSEYGRRGTADPAWPKYSNLVSKRERLHRILTQDFGGNKDKFFNFFSTPPPASKKRKRDNNGSSSTDEHFRSFRKIVEAIPWCETDLAVEHRKEEYISVDGEFCEVLWVTRTWYKISGIDG
ncbi:hypothetical protein B0H10DRAFT_2200665 [Mycena sp. CBHHK59/15]|nr:hypothetical protein B0H10DRAFT_2200665 [Mycena sp. CBHHK59/15]